MVRINASLSFRNAIYSLATILGAAFVFEILEAVSELMTRAKKPYSPAPRIRNKIQIAARLGWSESTFDSRREQLEALGFPPRDELLSGWDTDAIEAWLDRRAGLDEICSHADPDEELDNWEKLGCSTS